MVIFSDDGNASALHSPRAAQDRIGPNLDGQYCDLPRGQHCASKGRSNNPRHNDDGENPKIEKVHSMNLRFIAKNIIGDLFGVNFDSIVIDMREFASDIQSIKKEAHEFLDGILKDDLIPPSNSWSVARMVGVFTFIILPYEVFVNDDNKCLQCEDYARRIVIKQELCRRLLLLRSKSKSQFKLRYMELLSKDADNFDSITAKSIKTIAKKLLDTKFKKDKLAIEKLMLLE